MNWSWLPKVVLVLLVFVFTGILVWQYRLQDERRIQDWINHQSSLLEHAVKEGYGRHLRIIGQWERYWHVAGMASPADARALMDAYRTDFDEVRAIGLVEGLSWYVLSADNLDLWLQDHSLPRRHLDSMEQARLTRSLAVPYDFYLPDGQLGVYLYLPLRSVAKGPDLAMISISLGYFMNNRVKELFSDLPVRVIVRDERHRVIYDSAPTLVESPYMARFELDPDQDGAPWEFILLLTQEGLEQQSLKPYVGMLAAAVLMLGLMFLIFRESTRRRRMAEALRERERQMERHLAELNAARNRLKSLLYHDKLTGLPNRKALLRDLERGGQAVYGFLIRIQVLEYDRLRELYGYENSKEILKIIAASMREAVQRTEVEQLLYALEDGGFAVWLRETEESALDNWRQGWEEAMQGPFQLRNMQFSISQSMGVTALQGPARQHPEEWLQQAEVALNQARLLGGGGFVRYREGMLDRARRRMELGGHLAEYLQDNCFELYYQPVVGLRSGKIRSVEAFLRLNHPDFGRVFPTVFVPLAESNGMVLELDRWMLRQACKDWPALKAQLPPGVRLELNLSNQTLLHEDFPGWLEGILASAGVQPVDLCLNMTRELDEAVMERGEARLYHLHEMGVEVALDVESPHFHSLAKLSRQPLSLLKIDRSVILRLGRDDGVTGVLYGLIELAEQMHLQVVAEGVETAETADWLRDVGCQFAQGYFYLPPLPLHTLLDRLAVDLPHAGARQEPR